MKQNRDVPATSKRIAPALLLTCWKGSGQENEALRLEQTQNGGFQLLYVSFKRRYIVTHLKTLKASLGTLKIHEHLLVIQ